MDRFCSLVRLLLLLPLWQVHLALCQLGSIDERLPVTVPRDNCVWREGWAGESIYCASNEVRDDD